MLTTRSPRFVLAALLVLVTAGVTSAQTQIGGMNLEGYGEAGVRFFAERPSHQQDAKFEEYRDLNDGLYLGDLQLRLHTPDEKYSFELGGRQWGLQDQEYHLSAERLGLWQGGFDWDQMRHIFSTDARMLAVETSRGVFSLPTPRPPLSTYNLGSRLDEISVRWDTAHMYFKFTPTPNMDVIAEYSRIRKDGDRPMGMAFGSPGNGFLEILQPLEQTIHDFRLRGTYATQRWQLQFGYTLSVFENDLNRVQADNPCSPAPVPSAPCSASDITGPRFGTTSLPPDNMAHTLSLSGGVNLPLRTRITGNFTYSLRLQNDNFLPQTSTNPSPDPSVVLPAKSLHGDVRVTLFNLNATSRPLPIPVTFSAKYRLYDLADYSNQLIFKGFQVDDAAAVTPGGPTRAGRFSFQRQNAELDGRWKITETAALTVGPAWERWDRGPLREVPETDEFFAKAALDLNPAEWLMVRATYLPSFKRVSRYNTNAAAEGEEGAEPGELGQSYLLRKYDEADRNRQRADLLVQIMPTGNVTITPTVGYKWDNYIASGLTHDGPNASPAEGNVMLGLQQATSWSAGMDVNWTPAERLAFAAGYVREYTFQKMRSRSRTPSLDDPTFDWISDMTDTVDTYHASVTARLIPGVLDLKLAGNYSYALGRVETWNPNATGSKLFATNASARAFPFPAYEDSLLRLDASLKYHFAKVWTASLNYAFEQFRKQNWQTDTLNPFQPGVSSIWLGNDLKNYEAHIVGLSIAYQFK